MDAKKAPMIRCFFMCRFVFWIAFYKCVYKIGKMFLSDYLSFLGWPMKNTESAL